MLSRYKRLSLPGSRYQKSASQPHTVIQSGSRLSFELLTRLSLEEADHLHDRTGLHYSGYVLIAKGGESTIRLGKNRADKNYIAVRKLRNTDQFMKEAVLYRQLPRHGNVLNPIDYCVAPGKTGKPKGYVFLPLATRGSVDALLKTLLHGDLREMPPQEKNLVLKTVAYDVLSGLQALNTAGIAHRDIKPKNVLLFSDGTAKWTDFGFSGVFAPGETARDCKGTPGYLSPELKANYLASTATPKKPLKAFDPFQSDLYSLGCFLYEMENHANVETASDYFWLNKPEAITSLTDLSRHLLESAPADRMPLEQVMKLDLWRPEDRQAGRKILKQRLLPR